MLALCVVVVLLAGVVAALAAGRFGGVSVGMPDPVRPGAHQPLGAGEVTRADLAAVRFDRAPRGYRMDEVDAVLDRLGEELAARDERLAEMTRRLEGHDVAWSGGQAAPATPVDSTVAEPASVDSTTAEPTTFVSTTVESTRPIASSDTVGMSPHETLSRPQAPRDL